MAQHSDEVRDFLTSRRDRLTPEQAGLPLYGTNRRVKGLRRDEVAVLSGMSTDYYTRMERGNLAGVSEQVLTALASALQLDEAERTHLFDLARVASAGAASRAAGGQTSGSTGPRGLRPGVRRLLDTMSGPAYVRNARMDLLALNAPGRALFAGALGDRVGDPAAGFNLGRYLFLTDDSREFFVDWATVARDSVGALRVEAGRDPYDRGLTDLVGELSTRSEEFRQWWASHRVTLHRTATKRVRHAVVGEIEVTGEALGLPADPGLTLIAYTVEPASQSAAALDFLVSWSAGAPGTSISVSPGEQS